MALQNPYLQRRGPFADAPDGGAPPAAAPAPGTPLALAGAGAATGGAAAVPDFGQQALPVQPGTTATRVGRGLGQLRRTIGNAEVGGLNAALRGGAAIANAMTSGPRSVLGFARDAGRAANGLPELPNAGQPLAGVTAPQLRRPYADIAAAPGAAARTGAAAGGTPALDPNYNPAADNISAANLAAAQRLGAPQVLPDTNVRAPAPSAPVVDSGTTIRRPDGTTARLNYGAMVNGVPTFSDGSGGLNGAPGTIPRTVSEATLTRLAAAPSIGRADVGALGTALASDALGGTPTQEQMVQQRINGAQLTRPITGSRPSAAQFAASDLASIASGDPRSALGTAASNLRSEAAYGTTPRLRRMAESQLQQLTGGVAQLGQQGLQGEQAAALGQQQGDQAMALESQRGANQLADTALQLRRPTPLQLVQQADGTYAGIDTRTNTASPTIGADGKPLRGMATRDDATTRRTQEIQDQLAKTTAELAKNWLPDPKNPNATPPFAMYREQAARAAGLPVVKNDAGQQLVNINGQWMPL